MDHKLCASIPVPGKATYGTTPAVNHILKLASELNTEEYFSLSMELMKNTKCDRVQQNKIKNFITDSNKTSRPPVAKGINSGKMRYCEDQVTASGQQRSVDPGASNVGILSDPHALPAFRDVPFICRGDIFAGSSHLFVDVEKVSLKRDASESPHVQLASAIAIVVVTGKLIFWSLVNHSNVCQYNAQLTGLTKEKLQSGLPFNVVHRLLSLYFKSQTIVGLKLKEDFESLGFGMKHYCLNPVPLNLRLIDLETFYKDSRGQSIGLGMLSQHFLDTNIQEHPGLGTFHTAISDARMTLVAYRRMERIKSQNPEIQRFMCPVMDEFRLDPRNNPQKKSNIKWDRCSCGLAQVGGKKKKKGGNFGGIKNINFDDFMFNF